MLKITVQGNEDAVTLKIEGRVVDTFVGELDRAWKELSSSLGQRKLVVDLRGVTFMDRVARDLLATIHTETGAEFLANTPLTKFFAVEAMQSVQTQSR